jgi:hypothetical protein
MGKSVLLKLGMGILAVAFVCGCAAMGKGPTDEELITALLGKYKATGEAQDIEGSIALFSDKFEGEQGDKDDMKEFMLEAKEMGYLDDMEVILEDAEITIDGDTATVYPLEVETAMGAATLGLTLTKEPSGWMITGMEMES